VYKSSGAAKRVLFPFCSKELKNKLETLELDTMHFIMYNVSVREKSEKIAGTFRNSLTGA
jgi:hypothetical protein